MGPGSVLVLMYHQIDPEEAPDSHVPNDLADPRYGVRLSAFREQMALLVERKIPVAGLDECLAGSIDGRPPLSVVVTFDDGYASDFERAAPVLEELGLPATFFLATGHLGRPGMLTEGQAREISRSTLFSIGSHGVTHRFLSHLSRSECEEELERSLETLSSLSGKRDFSLSAPGGRANGFVANAAKSAGFRALLTSRPGVFRAGGDGFSIPRLPVMKSWEPEDFLSLLDPDSFPFWANSWVRSGKSLVRTVLEFPRTRGGWSR